MLDGSHLDAGRASTLFDLGCGFGKLALQAFFQYPNLVRVTGVELCKSRYVHACQVIGKWTAANNDAGYSWEKVTDRLHRLQRGGRVFELRLEDMFTTPGLHHADIVICETGISQVILTF